MNIVQEVAATLGGQAIDLDKLADLVADQHPDLYVDRTRSAFRNWVREQLRKTTDGDLPFALSVDGHGTFRQLSFMDIDEFRFTIRQFMRQSSKSRHRAYALADECERLHGVRIDPVEAAA